MSLPTFWGSGEGRARKKNGGNKWTGPPTTITQLFIPFPSPPSPPSASIVIAITVDPFHTVDFFAVAVAIEPSFAVEPLIAISIAAAVEHSIAVAVAVNPFHTVNFFAVPVAVEPSVAVNPAIAVSVAVVAEPSIALPLP
jgi:hypothetical protein